MHGNAEMHKLCIFYENVNNCLEKFQYNFFEKLNYLNKNIVSAYFTREKAEKIGKNEMLI